MRNKSCLILGLILTAAFRLPAHAAETVCAVVNLELGQQAALEREGFSAKLALTNNLGDLPLSNLNISVSITDANGNAADHLFFTKITDLENIAAIDGTGLVQPGGKAVIKWLIIPSAGAGGTASSGIRYNATARMTYYTGGVPRQTTTIPAVITVKPQPQLRLEYVLPFEAFGDNPLTPVVESTEPFPLGLRVTNVGAGTAKNFQIASGQPQVTVNDQGLVTNFQIVGDWLGADAQTDKTFDMQFGDIGPGASKQAAWSLVSSLAGRFTDFTASFTHSAELGGALTSLIESAQTDTLIKDVIVDLPGRDAQFDFLINKSVSRSLLEAIYQQGEEPSPEFIMESDRTELIPVQNLPAHLTGALSGSNSVLRFAYDTAVPTNTWVHSSILLTDNMAPVLSAMRADGKLINPRNVWISKHYNKVTEKFVRHLHVLDYTGAQAADYAMTFNAAALDIPPAAIADLAVVPAGNGAMALTWTATGEDGNTGTVYGGRYAIFYSTESGVVPSLSSAQVQLATTTTAGAAQSCVLPGLLGNTTYQFAVYMADAQGQYSAVSNIITTQTAILPPAGLESIAVASGSLNIGWLAANNNSSVAYSVWVDTDSVEPVVAASPYKDAADRVFVFDGLTPNTTYLISGQAKNPDTGALSALAYLGSTVTLAAQPGALVSSGVFVSSLTLAWAAAGNPGWTEYFVQLSTAPGWSPAAATSAWQAQTSYAFTGLAQNTTYYARVKAKNSAGIETSYTDLGMLKTKFFDTLPPVTVISFAGPGYGSGPVYVSSHTAISLTASDDVLAAGDKLGAVAFVHYSVDSDTFTVYAGSFSIVAGGAHVARYYSVDAVGNAEAVKTSSITVDDVPPVVTVEISSYVYSFGGTTYITGSSTITLKAFDTLAGLKELNYELNGTTHSVPAASQAFNLAEGAYNLAYNAVDNLGNTSALLISSITVDNTAPAMTFGVQGSSAVISGNLYLTAGSSVSLTAADALSGVKEINYGLDGSTAVAASSLLLPVTAGEHALAFYSVDNVGNVELKKSVTFFVDAEAPVTTAAVAGIAGANGWYVSPVVLTLASTDTMSGVENVNYGLERRAGSELVLLSSGVYSVPLTVNEEGVYNYSYSAADRAGNIETATTGYFKIDLSTPEVVAVSTPSANAYAWNNSAVTAVFSGADSASGIAFCTPGIPVKIEGSSQTISGYCLNYAGLSSTASVTVNIDTTAPVVSYARVPAASTDGWNNSDVTVSFTCVDALSGVVSCPASITLASEGANISTAAAVYDFAGNSLAVVAGDINIDRTPPVSTASLSGIANNGYYGGVVGITITSTDTLSGVYKTYYSLNNGDFALYQGTVAVSAEGRHTVRYYAQDKAGNIEAAKTLEFAIDTAGPSVSYSIVPPPNAAGWNNSAVEIVFTGTDTLSGISACSSGTVATQGLAQAAAGWCRDLAGNISYATATINIDLTTPVIAISSPAAGAVFYAGGGKFQVGWTVIDSLDLTSSVTVQLTQTEDKGLPRGSAPASIVVENGRLIDPSGLDDGIWRVEATAKDLAGNSTQAVSGLFEIVHDTIAPQTSLSVGAPKFTAGGTAFITSHTPLLFGATDDMLIAGDRGGTGVAATYVYVDSQTVAFSSGVFLPGESTHTVSYFSVDLAGNREAANAAVFAVDDSSPASAIAFSSGAAAGANGGFVIPKGSSVSFTAADLPAGTASGVSAVWYSVDSGTAAVFPGAFTLAVGSHTIVYWGVDNLGNTEAYRTALVSVSEPGWSVKLNLEPSTLNLNSKGEAVTAKLWMVGSGQECFRQETLNINSINGQTLANPIYAQSAGQRRNGAYKVECGTITVKFDRDALIAVLPVNAVSNITVSGELSDGQSFSAGDRVRTVKPHKISRRDGGRFEHSRRARFEAPAKALKEDADSYVLSVEGDKPENESRKVAAAKAGSLERRGYAYEFGPEGSVFDTPVTISLPYDAGEKSPEKLAIAYWNEAAGAWEMLTSRRAISDGLVKAEAPHFSQYQVVAATYMVSGVEAVNRFRASQMSEIAAAPADAAFRLGEVYVFPNPAKGGKVPVFHVEVGLADSVKIKIFTVSGQAVYDATLTGTPQVIGSVYAYEYAWQGHIASGVYYYTMEAERAGKKLRAKGKFAVVR